MTDIILERQTYILISDNSTVLYPSEDLFPDDGIYPASMTRIDNIVAGSMSISEILSESTLEFGQLFATQFECQVYDVSDVSGKYITVIQTEGNDYRIVFTGLVDSCKLDRLGTDRTIVAYDLAYSKSFINVANWWNTFWQNKETATLKQLRDSLLTTHEIEYIDTALLNDDVLFTKAVNMNSMPFGTMLKMICELSACFPHFNRHGVLEFIVLNSGTGHNLDDANYEGENSTFEEYTSDPFTGVQFYSSSGDIKSSIGTDVNSYSISGNVLIYGLDDATLNTIGTNILNAIRMLIYRPSTVKMVVSDFDYKIGDYVVTTKGFFYIFKMDFSGSQLVEQTMRADGKKVEDEVGVDVDVTEIALIDIVDEMDDEIDDLYEVVDENGERLDDYEQALEDVLENIEHGDNLLRSTMAETTGQDVWHIYGTIHGKAYYDSGGSDTSQDQPGAEDKYNISISYLDYGEPYANFVSSEKHYSNQGYAIQQVCDVTPNGDQKDSDGDYVFSHETNEDDNYDLNKYFMDGTNGDIYLYKMTKSSTPTKKIKSGKKPKVTYIFTMQKVKNGLVASTDYDWDIFPEGASIGDYYINLDDGKIYLLEGNQSDMYWTYKYQCPSTKLVHETMVEQTAHEITLEATARAGDDALLSSRIQVAAHGITLESSGSGQSASLIIHMLDENGNPLPGDSGNIELTGLVKFTDLSGTSSTFINGGNIQTNTIEASTLKATESITVGDGSITALDIQSPLYMHGNTLLANYIVGASPNASPNDPNATLTLSAQNIYLAPIAGGFFGGNTTVYLGNLLRNQAISPILGELVKYGPHLGDGSYVYGGTEVDCQAPFKYTIFPYLTSNSGNANIRCRNTDYGTDDSYTFAPLSQSSQRWKHDIKPIEDESIDPHKLYDLEVDQFIFNLDYLEKDDQRYNTIVPGLIAEKVAIAYPIAAELNTKTGQPTDWNERFIIPPMLKLIQEQNERIKVLEEKIKQLEMEE